MPEADGIHAPEDDEPRVRIVDVGDAGHLAVEGLIGGAGRRGADGSRQARRPERAEERGVGRVLRQQPVRAAVAERQDRFGAPAVANRAHPLGDLIERFVPGDPRKDAVAPRALADRRIEQTILTVDALSEPPDLRADVIAGDWILVAAVDLEDPAVLDGDVDRAGVRAVERAGGPDGRMSPVLRFSA